MIKQKKSRKTKEKIGTILEKDIIKKIKSLATEEERSISDIIHDAVLKYENTAKVNSHSKKDAVNRFCSRPFDISQNEIDELLSEDYYTE